jgi:hypothetical protein
MDKAFFTYDFFGRCLDASIPLIISVAGLFYYPKQITKDIASGKLSETDGKRRLKIFEIAFYLIMLLGLLKLAELFQIKSSH